MLRLDLPLTLHYYLTALAPTARLPIPPSRSSLRLVGAGAGTQSAWRHRCATCRTGAIPSFLDKMVDATTAQSLATALASARTAMDEATGAIISVLESVASTPTKVIRKRTANDVPVPTPNKKVSLCQSPVANAAYGHRQREQRRRAKLPSPMTRRTMKRALRRATRRRKLRKL